MAAPPLESLRLDDMSDREVLLVVRDVSATSPDGWVLAVDVADQIGVRGERRKHSVSSRLAWLRRFGAAERELLWDENSNPIMNRAGTAQRTGQRWRLTDIGLAIANGNLRRAQERAVWDLDDSQALLLTRLLAGQIQGADSTACKLAEREWRRTFMRSAT
jgi:hypothetical protein